MWIPVLRCTSSWLVNFFYFLWRQNRRDRLLRKRWSHIPSNHITLLENNELNVISLKVNEVETSQSAWRLFQHTVKLLLQSTIKWKLQHFPHFLTIFSLQIARFYLILEHECTQTHIKRHGHVCSVEMSLFCPHQIEEERKNMKFQIRRAFYDRKVAGRNILQ